MNETNLVKVQITNEIIVGMLTKGWSAKHITCIEGLPESAKYVRGYTDERGDAFWIFEDKSFEMVRHGREIPSLTPIFQIEYPEDY